MKAFFKFLLFAALVVWLMWSAAHAQSVGVTTVSYHSHGDFNNANPGVYYRSANEGAFWMAGGYYNSHSKVSVLVGAGYEASLGNGFSIGAAALVVTGYERASVVLGAMATGAYEFMPETRVRVIVSPKVKDKTDAWVFTLAVEKEF